MTNTILLIVNILLVLAIPVFYKRMLDEISSRMEKDLETLFDAVATINSMINEYRDDVDELFKNHVQVTTSPNKVNQKVDKTIPLSEDSPWTIPDDVRVEVEGGDTNMPYGFGG